MASRIFILDDDSAFVQQVIREVGSSCQVSFASTEQEFRANFEPHRFDLILLDMRLHTGREGLEVLREIHRLDPLQPVIIATAYADTETYLEAIQAGALMYLDKKRVDPASLAQLLDAVIQQGRLRRQHAASVRSLERMDPIELVGASEEARRLRSEINRVAALGNVPVIVAGDPGTGRELVARNVYARTKSADTGLMEVLAAQAMASHELRAAVLGDRSPHLPNPRRGLLEETHQGALLIRDPERLVDETIQLILRAWREHRFTPVGASTSFPFNGRLFFICNQAERMQLLLKDSEVEIIRVASLRERLEDIPLLVPYLLETLRRRGRSVPTSVSPEVQVGLRSYPWPGNVAELKAVLEFACLQSQIDQSEIIESRHLPVQIVASGGAMRSKEAKPVWDLELHEARAQVELVERAMEELATSNKTRLAEFLGLNAATTLTRRLERCLQRYPQLAQAHPRLARNFGTTRIIDEPQR